MAVELAQALVHEVVIDDRQAQRGADSAARALDRVADASDHAAGAAQRARSGLLQFDDATAKFTRGQESAWRALDRWKSRTDDAYRANKTLESATRDLDRAIAQGISTEAEKIQILDRLRQQTTRYAAANESAARSTKLAAHEVTNLSYQIQDAAVQLAGGQNPFLILMQQGPQATGAVGGVGRAISLLASPTGLAIAAVGGLVAAFSLVERHAAALREVGTSVTLMGGAIGRSADEMEALAGRAAEAGKISVASAREQEVAYIRAGKLGAESMERLIGLSRDYSVATKQDVVKASEDLAQLFADPVAGAEKLTAAYGLLTGKELERIRVLTATGQAEQARLVLADSLATRTRGLGDQVGTLAAAWERVARAASNAINAIGDATAPETNAQAIARLEERRRQLIAARGLNVGRLDGETGGAAVPEGAVPVDSRYSAPGMATANGELATVDASLAQRYAQRARDREMAARVGDWQGQVKNSAAADAAARSTRPMVTEIASLTESITTLESGLKNPGLMAFADDAGRALEGLKNKRADYEAAAAKGLDIETDKRQRLAAVEQKYAGLVGPAHEARKAAEIERINLLGTATTAEERKLAVGAAVTQVAAGQTQALAQMSVSLTSAANAAKLNAEAAGQGEAAMRRAAIEAEVYAHRMDGTAAAVRASLEEQEKYARSQIHNEFARGIDQEVAANERLVVAMGKGLSAWRDAEIYNAAYLQTLKETTPAEANWGEKLQANIDLLNRKAKAADNKAFADYGQQLEDQTRQLQLQAKLIGATPEQAARLQVDYDINKLLIDRKTTYDQLSDVEKKQIDDLREKALQVADFNVSITRQKVAWEELSNSLGRAFDRLGDSLSQVFVEGNAKAVNWGNVTKAIIASLVTDLLKMAAINPLRNAAFGGSSPSLWDLGASAANQNAANQNGPSGAGNLVSAGSGAYSLMGGGGTGIMQGVTNWASEGIYNLTGSAGLAQGVGLGIQAAPWGIVGGLGASLLGLGNKNPVVSGLGGLVGSVAGGGLGGSALGGLLGSAAGPVGAVVGSFLGTALTGLFGGKPSVGANEGTNVNFANGAFSVGTSGADNGGDVSKSIALAQQAIASLNGVVSSLSGVGMSRSGGFSAGTMSIFEKDGRFYSDASGSKRSFGSADEAVADFVSNSLRKYIDSAATDGSGASERAAANIRKVIDADVGAALTQLMSDLSLAATNFGAAFDAVGKAQPAEIATQVGAVAQSFVTMRDRAEQLGLATDGLATSLKAATDRMIDSAIRSANGTSFVDSAMAIRETFTKVGVGLLSTGQSGDKAVQLYGAQMQALVNSLGEDENAVKNLQTLADAMRGVDDVAEQFALNRKAEVQAMLDQAAATKAATEAATAQAAAMQKLTDQSSSLTAWLNGQALGDTSSLSGVDKMAEAQRQFADALTASRQSGDISAATKAADALLQASMPVLVKGTEAYAQRESWVNTTLKNLGHEMHLPGFRTGGSFEVGGWGGEDTTLVRFMATPGERVTITRPDQVAQPQTQTVVVRDNQDVVRALSQAVNVLSAKLDQVTAKLSALEGEDRRNGNIKLVAGG